MFEKGVIKVIYLDNLDELDQAKNFAMEEYALRFLPEDETYFMFYRMNPSVIVGKNQNVYEEINHSYIEQNQVDVLRRLSGGGAVYNDLGNISFSIITKDDGNSFQNFEKFTLPVIKALETLGVKATLSGRNDIEIDGKKISGNAQFITKGRLYSHGTLLFDVNLDNVQKALHVDPEKYLSKGVKSVRSRVTNIREHLKEDMDILGFKQVLLNSIFGTKDIPTYSFTEEDLEGIKKIEKERYRNPAWTYGRSPKGLVTKKKRFDAGTVQFHLETKKGFITEIKMFGDFFGMYDISELEEKLIGIFYTREALREVLTPDVVACYFGRIPRDELLDFLL